MTLTDKQINTGFFIGLTAIGIAIAIKNHKRDGFWSGVGASLFIFGLSFTVHSKK